MAFEPIPLKRAIDVPAKQATTFDSLWVTAIGIRCPVPTSPADPSFASRPGTVYVEYYPMKSGTGELHSVPVEIRSEKLWHAVATVPKVAAAVDALLAAIRPLETYNDGQ